MSHYDSFCVFQFPENYVVLRSYLFCVFLCYSVSFCVYVVYPIYSYCYKKVPFISFYGLLHILCNFELFCVILCLWYILESYPLSGYILGSEAPGTNAVGASGAINGMKR